MTLRVPQYIAIKVLADRVAKTPAALSAWVRRYNGEHPEARIRRVHGAVVLVDFERAWQEAAIK
ncbi:hypothetical protein GC173_17195 [bacterium]|nr:hypothetical protein [bacterium]